MRSLFQKHGVMEKLVDFVERMANGHRPDGLPDAKEDLYAEIYQLEKTLANAPTRPSRRIQRPKPPEPLTEQQKIMDLAG